MEAHALKVKTGIEPKLLSRANGCSMEDLMIILKRLKVDHMIYDVNKCFPLHDEDDIYSFFINGTKLIETRSSFVP